MDQTHQFVQRINSFLSNAKHIQIQSYHSNRVEFVQV